MPGKCVEGGLEEGGCRSLGKLEGCCCCLGVRPWSLKELRHWQWAWKEQTDTRNTKDEVNPVRTIRREGSGGSRKGEDDASFSSLGEGWIGVE